MSRGKIVMCGCAELGINMVDELFDRGIKIDQFVCITPEKAEQLTVSGYVDFKEVAAKYNVPIHYAEKYNLKGESDFNFFKEHQFDILLVGGWQRLIPDNILNTLSIGGFGIHGSSEFLPKGRGRSPVNWSLIEGKKRFILHLFKMKPEADNGEIVDFRMFDINQWDDCRTMYYKISMLTTDMLAGSIPKLLSGDFQLIEQEGEPSYYPKRTPADGEIDWKKDLMDLYNFVRALAKPYPGAFSFVNGERINIWKAQPFDTRIDYMDRKVGEVLQVFNTGDVVVKTNGGLLLITEYEGSLKQGDCFSSSSHN